MTGDAARALQAFQNTLREAALLASRGQLPSDRLWSFHEARHQCLALSKNDSQPEPTKMQEEPIATDAAARVARLDTGSIGCLDCDRPGTATQRARIFLPQRIHSSRNAESVGRENE